MKKLVVTSSLIALAILTVSVVAQEELPHPGITPDSFLYGLDRTIESLQKALTLAPEARAKLALRLAAERLAEAKAMIDKGKSDLARQTTEDYEDEMDETISYGKMIAELAKKKEFDALVANATIIHIDVLERVLEKVPEQAKPVIESAINSSKKGRERSLESLSETLPEEVARMRSEFAEKRLEKAKRGIEEGKIKEAEKLVEEYEEELNEFDEMIERGRGLGRNVTALAEHVCAMRYKHIEVLEKILEKVPEPTKLVIEKVINASLERHANCTERILSLINKTAEKQRLRICKTDEDCEGLDIYCPTKFGFELTCYIPKNKTEGRCHCRPRWEKVWFNCTSDADCRDLVCPMMIGCDTPVCEEGRCKCGGKWRIKNRTEWTEEIEEAMERMKRSYNESKIEESWKEIESGMPEVREIRRRISRLL